MRKNGFSDQDLEEKEEDRGANQTLVTECFFNLFLEVSHTKLEQLEFKFEKNVGIQKQAGKVRKCKMSSQLKKYFW